LTADDEVHIIQLCRDLRSRIGDDFGRDGDEIRPVRTYADTIALQVGDVTYWRADGELTAGRHDDDGEPMFGIVDSDGRIDWTGHHSHTDTTYSDAA
jgi:hypothetical protein